MERTLKLHCANLHDVTSIDVRDKYKTQQIKLAPISGRERAQMDYDF